MILPVGVENCLQGLSFVFTGDLKDLSRQDAEDIVKRYGGRVMGQPSSKTSYVVVGEAAGPKKLELARVHNLSILDQDQFCDLVRTAKPKLPTPVKKDKGKKPVELATHEGELWTVKYKPNKYAEVIGNKGLVEKLAKWVVEWERNRVAGFPKGETSQFKAALLSGPPGIGKTTAAHLVGNIEGFEVIEFNASDTRNKKSLEMFVKEATTSTSISQMMAKKKSKKIIVMDEVDGMSAGDRGGSTELLNLIKKTKVPIICICNDRSSPKMKTLGNHCLDLKFRKPSAQQAEERLGMICRQEGLQLSPNVISQLIASTGGDVRQILNLLSTYRIKNTSLTFDQSKQLAKQSQKNIAKSPFEVASQLFSKEYFRTASLTDRIDLFFQDFSLIPLFVQENYLKTSPAFGSAEKSKKAQAHNMNLLAKASDSISASNLLEAMQQREQQWGLLPTIAVMSTVTPCFYTHGHMSSFPQFPSWLGQFSKSQKTKRILRELKTHMRLKISSDTDQLRLQYLPTLVPLLKKPLMDEDLEKTLDVMDAYFITREDVDGIQELGFEFNIPSKTKTAFTRAYNKRPHLQPYAEVIGKPKKITSTEIVNPDDELVMETEQVQEEEEEEEEDIVVPAKKPTKQTKKGKKKA
ncbi:replication factor RFC1 C terminal domain-containing protein [Gorgonomyces haynaldii]|nr:replication factor RFC1 C terminal domain-containing protein [Gorgonomyces haynaldii]